MDVMGVCGKNSFEEHPELHLFQTKDKVSIAEHACGSQFSLDMKIATETEKFLKQGAIV
jgi:pterin-4a-carbinolamine dehydratase